MPGYDKGLNLPAEEEQQKKTTTPETTPIVPQQAYTYQEDANGNIVAGKGTGAIPGTNLNTEESLIAQQPEAPQTTEVSAKAYLNPWGQEGFTVDQALKNNPNLSIKEIMDDHRQWANDTGGSFSIFDYVPHMEGKDITKSQAENEKDAKKQARQEKFERLGNFLAHLGNFVGAAAFGAPSQTLESGTALTERQKKMRDAQLAVRNAYNKNYLEQYWKSREEDYKNTRLNQYQQSLDRQEAELYLKEKQFDEKMSREDRKLQILQDYRNGLLSQGAAKIAIQQMNAETARMNAATSRMRANKQPSQTKETYVEKSEQTELGEKKTTEIRRTGPAGSVQQNKPKIVY